MFSRIKCWQGFKYVYNENHGNTKSTKHTKYEAQTAWQGFKYVYNELVFELCFNIPVKTSQTIRLDAVHLTRLLSQDETAPLWVIGKTS